MTKERLFELARLALIDRWAEATEICDRYPDNWALKAKKKAIEKELSELEEMKNKLKDVRKASNGPDATKQKNNER